MHQHKKEYSPKKEKREDKVIKTINCVNCGKIIAEGGGSDLKIIIVCRNCGVKNTIEASAKDTEEQQFFAMNIDAVNMSKRNRVYGNQI